MNQIKFPANSNNEIDTEIEALRKAASQATEGLRTLRDIEMGWIAGGDSNTTWV